MSCHLYDYQLDAVKRMKNGCILCGDTGSGKSTTGLYYYFKEQGGSMDPDYIPMKDPRDLYIITPARKRDLEEWESELGVYLLSTDPKSNYYKNKVVVDSWQNIRKYKDVYGAFFIFDEDRLTGSGQWVKCFLKMAKRNQWIILSATPGDSYSDYIPVFIANGFYPNKTTFQREHVIYSRFTNYPKIDGYMGTKKLDRLRDSILIDMDFKHRTVQHHEDVYCNFNVAKYKDIYRNRWNEEENKPIENAAELCFLLRKVVNSDESRQVALLQLLEDHPKAIIFYNYNYERDILRDICNNGIRSVAEWNGSTHEAIPSTDSWVYIVQYAAAEAWNCITTDTVIFYSQNYSYKTMKQASGRIDRVNTSYKDLYYYHLKSRAGIDLAISKAIESKKLFNEKHFTKWDKQKEVKTVGLPNRCNYSYSKSIDIANDSIHSRIYMAT